MVKRKIKFFEEELDPLLSKKTKINVEDFLNLYSKFFSQKTLEGLRERTLEDYKEHFNYLKKWVEAKQRTTLARCFDSDFIFSYIYHMKEEKGLKATTINIRLRTLKTYLKWLHENGYIDKMHNKIKLQKMQKDTIQPLSKKNIHKMLQMPDKTEYTGFRDYCLMLLMLDNGIRTKEALNLKIDDLDIKNRTIIIRKDVAKTGSTRKVAISRRVAKLLEVLIKNNDKNVEYVFQSVYGKKLQTTTISRTFAKYGKKAGIKERVSGHVWRHTFAINFLKSGGDVFTLQKILGHTSMEMTRKYVQLSQNDIQEQFDKTNHLEKLL